jgi:hypothetical protein
MEKLKYAQDLIKTRNSSVSSGFNMFINGSPQITFGDGYHDAYARMQGWEFAEEMAKNGEIYFTHKFKCECGGNPIEYGGFWCCNSCGRKGVDKEWWKIKVEKDGKSFCCHGLNFKSLMESKNYAFGDTFEEAISNYEKVMVDELTTKA